MNFKILSRPMFSKLRATWLYRRGMVRAKLRQNVLAIEDYTTVIEMDSAPTSIRAMALFNRALVYHATDRESQSIEDFNKVLVMKGATGQVKTEARRQLVRMTRTSHRTDAFEQNFNSRSQGGSHAHIKSKATGKHTD